MAGSREIVSLSDSEPQWGFKSKKQPLLGYKAHTSCDENGLVTAVRVETADELEVEQPENLIEEAENAGIDPSAKRMDEFKHKEPAGRIVAICPCGVSSTNATPHQMGGFIVCWSEKACKTCSNRESCVGGRLARSCISTPRWKRDDPGG